jgi:hypothetical protein
VTRPFLDTSGYSGAELFWYVGGFLAWTPAYVAIIAIAIRHRRLEIPALAATGNITWEFLWGFVYGGDLDMGWGLQAVYIGAFLLDVGILVAVFRFGPQQVTNPLVRRLFPMLVCGLLAAWLAIEIGLEASGRDLPLGSISAYLVNVAVSGVYLWLGLTADEVRLMSRTVAWSKFIGTAMVSVFVVLRYPGDELVLALAGVVAVLDVAYLVVLSRRRRGEPAPSAVAPSF